MDSIKQKRRLQKAIFSLVITLVLALLGIFTGVRGAFLAEEAHAREEFALTLRDASLLPGSISGSVHTEPEKGEISFALSPFTLPGEYAALEISVENTGMTSLSLAEYGVRWDTPSPAFRLSLPDLSGEILSPGERCRFSVVLSFSPEGENGELPSRTAVLRLCYTGDREDGKDIDYASQGGAPPKTDDPGRLSLFAILGILSLALLCFAVFFRFHAGRKM